MITESLNGEWSYRVGGGKYTKRTVPFSALAVGHSECEREFGITHSAERIELKLDGITYAARVTLNGEFLSEMLPYCEYRFDITDKVRDEGNSLHIDIEDISPAFGPVAGWENFGGIIRDVSLVYGNREYIENVFFSSRAENDYLDAVCEIRISGKNTEGCVYHIAIFDGEMGILSDTVSASCEVYEKKISNVEFWSPDNPKLYKMQIKVVKNGEIRDTYEEKIGFREIKCDKHKFYLNGKPLFLVGVCKHEMIGESGHVVKYEDVLRDMKMIKELGCNFVRLVHYPHGTDVLRIADEIGLLVSEEPGLWWSDTSDPEVAAGSIEVLRRTILRDRNHPSIAFWLCFNECKFTKEFLIESARVCKATDPTRLVSGANCMSDEETLEYFNICGFDFYTMHPYAQSFDRAMRSAKILNDKPLVFTEWGGHFVYDNPKLMREFIYEMRRLYLYGSDKAALAGAFLWAFADVNDYNRERPAVKDGRLFEGLVDYNRSPHMCFEVYKSAYAEPIDAPSAFEFKLCAEVEEGLIPLRYIGGSLSYGELFAELWDREKPRFLDEQRPRVIKVGPVCGNAGAIKMFSEPLSVRDNTLFFGGGGGKGLVLLGCVSATRGYPLSGEYGELAAQLVINFADGYSVTYPIRNGIELTTVYTTYRSSRIDPIAERAERFLEFSYDKSFERYVINKLSVDFGEYKDIKSVELVGANSEYTLLTYGIYTIDLEEDK